MPIEPYIQSRSERVVAPWHHTDVLVHVALADECEQVLLSVAHYFRVVRARECELRARHSTDLRVGGEQVAEPARFAVRVVDVSMATSESEWA